MPAPPPESEPAIVSATGVTAARRRDPLAGAAFGIGVQRDVGDDGDDVGAGGEAGPAALDIEAADARRAESSPIRRFHSPMRSRPCGANRIAFRIVG